MALFFGKTENVISGTYMMGFCWSGMSGIQIGYKKLKKQKKAEKLVANPPILY
jgi:hypothetical protein